MADHMVVRTREERSLMGFIRCMWTIILSGIGWVVAWTIDNLIVLWTSGLVQIDWLTLPLAVGITGLLYGAKRYFWPDTVL